MSQTTVDQKEETNSDADPQTALAEPQIRVDEALAGNFWDSPTTEQLARAQNVQPMTDVKSLLGIWPGDEDDGFEVTINELRHPAHSTKSEAA